MQVTVNGVESEFPIPEGAGSFDDVVRAIRGRFESASQLLTSFKVNGVELTPADEATLSALRAEDIETVDLVISNPRELAEDTLRTLAEFVPQLVPLSRSIAEAGDPFPEAELGRLIDGLESFSEAVGAARSLLKVGFQPTVNLLEADMVSILTDLLEAHKTGQKQYRTELLSQHLPANLEEWVSQGIPALMRARDS